MSRGSWILVVVFLTILFLVSLWTIDVSLSAMRAGTELGNTFWMRSPGRAYHIGLWLGIGAWFSLSAIAVKFILGD